MSARFERSVIATTPLVALATLALGLRIGASSRVRGARIFAAPPGHGRSGVALQIVTVAEDAGATEIVSEPDITVVAWADGKEARWHGSSNKEGLAEAWVDLPGARPGETLSVSVTGRDGAVLANGTVALPSPPPMPNDAPVRPMRKAGALSIDVFPYGKLIPGAVVPVFARVRGAPRDGVDGPERIELKAEPEPGLSVATWSGSTCAFDLTSNDAWCEVPATAEFLTASWTLTARRASVPTQLGTWYGSLPVAPAGAIADIPARVDPGRRQRVRFVVPPATRHLYVEVDDAAGIDFAAALDTVSTGRGGNAETVLPPLAPGTYWLTTSSSLRESDAASTSTIARPFRVAPLEAEPSAGSRLVELVTRSPPAVPRPLALDGLLAPRRQAGAARRRGILVAFGALATASVLETLLILRALRRSRARLRVLSEAALEAGGEPGSSFVEAEGSRTLLTVAGLLFVTLLGFAVFAGLLAMSTS